MNNDVLAILISDFHLSHSPPTARSAEEDWYTAMARPLREVKLLADNLDVPVLCAGDIFHRWGSPPSLINFAIENLPKMYAVPGQHDLPHHSYDDIRQSAYWTLVEAGTIENVEWRKPVWLKSAELALHAFSWGRELETRNNLAGDGGTALHTALIHRYLWTDRYGGYPGAPAETNLRSMGEQLRGYDVAVFGDNHQQFQAKSGDCTVYNCGCLIRRTIAERDYRPAVGLLKADGLVEPHYLDTSEDKWVDAEPEQEEREVEGLDEFLAELGGLEADSLDFREALKRYLRTGTREDVEKILEEVMEG